MTSLIRLLFPTLKFPSTVENFGARVEAAGQPGDDRERERILIQALDSTQNGC
jgi:hypothetical protein